VLAKRNLQKVYNTIPKSREWLIVSCVINAIGSILLGFYIFKGKKSKMIILENVSKMQKKTWMTFFIQGIYFVFYRVNTKWHFSIQLLFTNLRWTWIITCYSKNKIKMQTKLD
jgi:hypothetical protein